MQSESRLGTVALHITLCLHSHRSADYPTPITTVNLCGGESVQIALNSSLTSLFTFLNLLTAEEHEDSRTKDDSIPEKSSDSLIENKVKKRRVRKKKHRKQDSEYGEESRGANEAKENTDTDTKSVSEEVKVTKRRNKAARSRGHGLDDGSCRSESENPDTAGQGEQIKCGNRRKKGQIRSNGPDIGSAPSRRVNDGEVPAAAGSVENVKFYVKRRNKGVGNCGRVDSENNLSRRILNSNDTPELSSSAGQVEVSKTHEEVVLSRGGNARDESLESSSAVQEGNKVVTPRKANDLGKNSNPSEAVRVLKRRNKIVSSSCANEESENPEPLNNGLKEGVNDIKRLEKVVDSRNVDDTGENPGTVKEVKHVRILKRGPPSSPVGNSICMVFDQHNVRWDHVTPWNRNRPSPAHNRDNSYATDVTQAGVTQGRNAAAGVTQRRRSFSDKVTKDSSGMERKENASRIETTEEYTKNRSLGDFSGDAPVRGWKKLTRSSAEIGNKPTKDHRRVYTTPRRRSFDHTFEKHFEGRDHLGNQRPCTTDNRSKSDEPENPERGPEEEGTATNSAELSSGKSKAFASCKLMQTSFTLNKLISLGFLSVSTRDLRVERRTYSTQQSLLRRELTKHGIPKGFWDEREMDLRQFVCILLPCFVSFDR